MESNDKPIPDDATRMLLDRLTLTKEQVSFLLSVPPSTVDNLHRMKVLPAHLVGKFLVWLPADVERYVASLGEDRERCA